MKTIYKYEIFPGETWVSLPNGATILTVGGQGDSLFMWAEVDSGNSEYKRMFEVFGTGHTIREDAWISREFIGTAFIEPYVWHVYERTD